jgi:histidine triad (HIT) family protein
MTADPNCIFCKIVRKEIAAVEVLRDEHIVAFRDVNPQAPTHILVVPVDHAENLSDFMRSATAASAARLLSAATEIGKEFGRDGYRVVINEGHDGGQTVGHLHAHVLAGRHMTWPPG